MDRNKEANHDRTHGKDAASHNAAAFIWAQYLSAEDSRLDAELAWLKEKLEHFAWQHNVKSKRELDVCLYTEMFHRPPTSDTQLLKIRYWRTGHHRPQNREQCILLGHALSLSAEEMTRLLQYYYDSADRVFTAEDADDPVYRERRALLQTLSEEYMWKAHPHTLARCRIPLQDPARYLRHYYYRDSMEYICIPSNLSGQIHLESAGFEGEFKKTMNLIGTVSRQAVLRLLLVMNAPFLSEEKISGQLKLLGYAPLTPGHRNRRGAAVDDLVLLLLEAYEEHCTGCTPADAAAWLRQTARELDRMAQDSGRPELRLFYFKGMR